MTTASLNTMPGDGRLTLSNFDRYEIARIQQEVTGLAFDHAQLLYEYRFKAGRSLDQSETVGTSAKL